MPAENSAHSVARAENDAGVRTECIQHCCAENVLMQCVQGKQQRMRSSSTAENETGNATSSTAENATENTQAECI